jgi:hypothetical protein
MKYLVLCLLFISGNVLADRGIYIGADGGKANAVRGLLSFDIANDGDDVDLEYEGEVAKIFTVGYGFNIWHLELLYADLGETGFSYGDYLTYSRQTTFTGIASRWRWGWFSLRYGIGMASSKNSVEDTTSGLQSVTHGLDTEDKTYGGTMFSVGLNIPVTESIMINLESASISWAQEDGKIEYDSGAGDTGDEDLGEIQMVWMFTMGVRFYLF